MVVTAGKEDDRAMRQITFIAMLLISLISSASNLTPVVGASQSMLGKADAAGRAERWAANTSQTVAGRHLNHNLMWSKPLPVVEMHTGRTGWINRKKWGRGRVEAKYNVDGLDWHSLKRSARLERRSVAMPGIWIRTAAGEDYEIALELEAYDVYAADYAIVDGAGNALSRQPPDNVLVLRGHVRGRSTDSEVLLSMTRSTCQVRRRGMTPPLHSPPPLARWPQRLAQFSGRAYPDVRSVEP